MTAIQETKVELLREKNIKSLECSNKAAGFELRDFFNLNEQTPTNDLKHLKRAYMDDLNEPAIGSLTVGNKPETPISTDYLTEQHCKDTQTIDFLRYELKESERKRKMEAESSDTWRNKYCASDKDKEKYVIENRNLKTEIEKMNQLLEQAYAKDALMDGVMQLYLDTKSKLIDSMEGEVKDIWR